MKNEAPKPATILAQADHYIDATTGAVTPLLITASTYARDADYVPRASLASRTAATETRHIDKAEQVLAKLEGAADAMLVASGIAAGSTLLRSLFEGDHLVIPRVMYHGLRKWVHSFSNRWGLAFSEFDPIAPNALEPAIRSGGDQARLDRNAVQSGMGCDGYRRRGAGAQRRCKTGSRFDCCDTTFDPADQTRR